MGTTTLRAARALTWACVLAFILITGIGTAQPTIAFRAFIFMIALIPAAAAIFIGSFVHDHTKGELNG